MINSTTKSLLKPRLFKVALDLCLIAIMGMMLFSPLIASDSLRPTITISKAQGDQCVLPADEIRRVHPGILKHDRIATVREGIRTVKSGKELQGSLKACVNCHAIKEKDEYVRVDNPKHFCKSCHIFAGVSFDCFQCHRDIPEQ